MTSIKDKPGGRPAKKRIEKQQRVVSTKLTELQYYAIRKRAGEAGLRVSEYVRQAVVSAEVIPRLNRQVCGHHPQTGRGSQQHQPVGAPGECRRFRTGSGGTGEAQKQDYWNHKPFVG
ncbi:Mobilization protein BmgB [Bacteroides xylanisolvens SD CC 2a]|nr:Mobilization protein BmgB [Bacteroides xylanisolvens SD CC 2a]